jgi:O-antigen/teichoic acid export membrane protein
LFPFETEQVRIILATPNTSTNLIKSTLNAVKWGYLGVVARIVIQLVVQILLARLLGPESFGLFALVLLVVGAGNLFASTGIAASLVQKKNVSNDDIRLAFTWQFIIGMGVAGFIIITAGFWANILNDQRVTSLLHYIAPVCFFQALSGVPSALLSRDLRFKAIQVIQICSYVVSFLIIGLVLAYMGAGVWSLVAAFLSQYVLTFILLYARVRHPIIPLFRQKDRAHMVKFGYSVLGCNLSNWVIENLDNFLVGRIFGAYTLGQYSVAYTLVRTPTNHLVTTLQSILFPVSALTQDNNEGLRRIYSTTIAGVFLISAPLFWGIAAASETIVVSLYGVDWKSGTSLLIPLAASMPIHAVMCISGPLLWGKGRVNQESKVQFLVALAFIVAIVAAGQFSVVSVAWAVFGVYFLRAVAMVAMVVRLIELSISNIFHALRGGLILGMITSIGILLVDQLYISNVTPVIRLALDVTAGGGLVTLAMFIAPRWFISAALQTSLHRIFEQFPCLKKNRLIKRLICSF